MLWNCYVSVNGGIWKFPVRSDVLIPKACVVCLPRSVRTAEEPCLLSFPQVLADAVSHLVVDKFSELTDNFTSPHARRKVLAGVVMTTGDFVGLFLASSENTWFGIFAGCSWKKQKILLLCISTFPSALQVFVAGPWLHIWAFYLEWNCYFACISPIILPDLLAKLTTTDTLE